MSKTRDLLAAARAARGLSSNYRLARELDVPEKTVQRWHTGKNRPDDQNAIKLAKLAGLDPAEVVAQLKAESAEDPELKAFWEGIAHRMHKTAMAVCAVILSLWIGGGPDGSAMAATPGQSVSAQAVDSGSSAYTLSRIWLGWLRWLFFGRPVHYLPVGV